MADHVQAPLAISMGEPGGVGPDLILKLYSERQTAGLSPFIVFGNIAFLRQRAARLQLPLQVIEASPEGAAEVFPNALPVVDIDGLVSDNPGKASPLSAGVVLEAVAQAVAQTMTGACRGLVTAPIHKAVLYGAGFEHPGHTEFLAALCANGGMQRTPVMMLAHEGLRVVPATIHVPLAKVAQLITAELIMTVGRTLAHGLRTRFGIPEPRIALTGLNPHAGENGGLGREELEIIGPSVANLQFEGIDAEGPFPADTLFHVPLWRRYDAVIAMYHDQALIPIKTVAFEEAVNVTLGLPIVRTSPDHGTAFDLAGTGNASSASLLAALRLADKLTSRSH